MWDGHLGRINVAKHRVKPFDDNTQPIHSSPYRAETTTREFEKIKIERMFKGDIIKPAQKKWATPAVFAPKKDVFLRFCVDYRRLHPEKKPGLYPIPHIDDCINSFGELAIFSKLDVNSECWQVEIDKSNGNKTVLTPHYSLFRLSRMSFGLRNAPDTFPRTMDDIRSSER